MSQKPANAMSPRRYALFMAATLTLIFLSANTLMDQIARGARLDLTQDRLYSLSGGTKTTLRKLAEPIDLTLYYSADASATNAVLRAYSARVRELLQSYVVAANGKVRLREVNPIRYTEAEDEAAAAEIEPGVYEQGGEPVYFGVVGANAADERVVISRLAPEREAYLEYELTRMIAELETPRRLKIALLSSLPLQPAMFAPPAQGQSGLPWVFQELARIAEIDVLAPGFTTIPADCAELVIVQPWDLTAQERYAVDQFILANGRAFIAVDPAAMSWSADQLAPSVAIAGKLDLSAWGVTLADDVVLDGQGALEVQTVDAAGRETVLPQPLYIRAPDQQLAQDDLITAGLDRQINFAAPGAISWTAKDGVIVTPLARSSGATARISVEDAMIANSPLQLLPRVMGQGGGRVETFAVRIAGTLPSAFGAAPPPELLIGRTAKHLAKSARPAEIVLVADTDFLNDSFYVSQGAQFADNGVFALNAIDILAGSDALVSLRSRAPSFRALEVLDNKRRAAQDQQREKVEALRAKLAAADQRIAALQAKGRGSGFFSGDLGAEMTPEEKVEVESARVEALRVRQELREVERGYRRSVESLQGWLTALNVWAGPMLIAGVGLVLFWRRQRRARGGGA